MNCGCSPYAEQIIKIPRTNEKSQTQSKYLQLSAKFRADILRNE